MRILFLLFFVSTFASGQIIDRFTPFAGATELYVNTTPVAYPPNEGTDTGTATDVREIGSGTLTTETDTPDSGTRYVRLAATAGNQRIEIYWDNLTISTNYIVKIKTRISTGQYDIKTWSNCTVDTEHLDETNTAWAEYTTVMTPTSTSGLIRIYSNNSADLDADSVSIIEQ